MSWIFMLAASALIVLWLLYAMLSSLDARADNEAGGWLVALKVIIHIFKLFI